MKMNVKDKLESLITDQDVRSHVLQDIYILHTAPSESLFDVAHQLFIQKWRKRNIPNISAFLEYFQTEWIKSHKGWFLGYTHGPTSNNGLESTNKSIKKEHTFRQQLPIDEFLVVSESIVSRWSKERDETSAHYRKSFIVERDLTTEDFTNAYQWIKNPLRKTIKIQNE